MWDKKREVWINMRKESRGDRVLKIGYVLIIL